MISPIDYLIARFRPGSGWCEYQTFAGVAVDWPTAYVAAALVESGAGDAAEAAVEPLLAGQQANGGWGYHRNVPDDCDSTAYALIFLSGQHNTCQAVATGAERLKAQQRSDGGFAAYGDERAIRAFMQLPTDVSLDGWTQTHPEVTAAAGLALLAAGEPEAAERAWFCLAGLQDSDGGWHSYWWTSDFYAAAFATKLAAALGIGDKECDRAAAWCQAQQTQCGAWTDSRNGAHSVLATALALQVLRRQGPSRAVEAGRRWLDQTRRSDGGWDGEFSLRIPPPPISNPATFYGWQLGGLGAGAVIRDEGGCYVTATGLVAMAA